MSSRALMLQACLALALTVTAAAQPSYALVIVVNAHYSQNPSVQGGTFNEQPPPPFQGGFNDLTVEGDFGFTAGGNGPNGTGTATITYAADLTIPGFERGLFRQGDYVLGAGILGYFATETPGHQIFLTQYTTDNFLVGVNGSLVHLGAPDNGDPKVLLPFVTHGNFKLSDPPAMEESDFGISSPFFLSRNQPIDIRQVMTVSFSGLQQGDVIDAQFPNNTNLDPAPEPGTLTLLGIGLVGVMGYAALRRRKKAAPAA